MKKALPIVILLVVVSFVLDGIANGPIGNPPRNFYEGGLINQARAVGQDLTNFLIDNDWQYPDGKSSTEIFQNLIDAGYITDPTIVYVPLPGKTKPVTGQKLKPENVCFDLTAGADANSPNGLPLVFLTGYRVSYVTGSKAVPLIEAYPRYDQISWLEQWHEMHWMPEHRRPDPGLAVYYKGATSAAFVRSAPQFNSDYSVPNLMPTNFNSKNHVYKQLTPNGPLL